MIQGSIKFVTYKDDLAKVGYVLGLRVVPHVRRRGIGSSLVFKLEEWFKSNDVDYAYMATEKENQASVNLFMNKFGYTKFRTPSILVNPVNNHRSFRISSNIEISAVKIDQAESLYRSFMGTTTEFFPNDIDKILRNKLSLGTWVAHFKGDYFGFDVSSQTVPNSWAMISVWNSGEIFKLRLGKAPFYCLLCTKSCALIHRIFPCLGNIIPSLPDFFSPFGFYFVYGVYHEGPSSGKLVRGLCEFVHNMAAANKCCKIVVTEVGGRDELKHHIPHWKLLSTPEDLWCIKALKNNNGRHDDDDGSITTTSFHDLTKTPPSRALFVDPREV